MNLKKNNSNKQLFWPLQIIGWGLFTLLNLTARQYFVYFHFSELVNSLVLGLSLFISTSLLRKYYQRYLNTNSVIKSLLQMLLASTLAGAFAMTLYAAVIVPNQVLIFGQETEELELQLLISSPMIIFLIYAWSAIYAIFKKQQLLKQVKQQQDQLGQSLKEAKLDVLLSQLNPHFIFNAINNIRALILEDSNKARDMLADLSEVMRHTMQIDKTALIPLHDELNVVKQYLALNQLQFEHKLKVEYHIADNTLNLQLPPMIIQLLVENALKHGIGKLKSGGLIRITSEISQPKSSNKDHKQYWLLSIENSGLLTLNSRNEHNGIGIKNIKERLALVFDDKAKFDLIPSKLGVLAQLTLPLTPPLKTTIN